MNKQQLAVLGSTGSIGCQTEIVETNQIVTLFSLAANRNISLLRNRLKIY